MKPELYRRASALFGAIRELPECERAAAIDSACGGEDELRQHLLRLLEADGAAAGEAFLDGGAIDDAARLLTDHLPAAGTVIGNFRLCEQIGSGGMGVIFRAEDLRLSRTVALKLLPHGILPGKEHIQRFHREARAASLLNHPNIVSVFEASFDHGWPYIAMEFVEGRTLRQLIAGHRPLEANAIVDLISQAASALSAAHEAGIVHRDIKPENIMVRNDGFVKVLDFGLAKLRETAGAPASGSQLQTRPGNVPGTVQYLSPEQVLGDPAGPRSDLFSLGVVAYELATGVRPFEHGTDGAVFNAILHHNAPAPSSIRASVSPELDALILRLIEKDPELRFQTAADLRSHCRRLVYHSSSSQSAQAKRTGVRRNRVRAATALALVAGAAAWFLFRSRSLAPGEHRQIVRLTDTGRASRPALSPDGKYLAYISSEPSGNSIHLRQVATGADIQTVTTAQGTIPGLGFSADGAWLYFDRAETRPEAEGLFRVPLLGGNAKRISAHPHMSFAMSHDGRFAAYMDRTEGTTFSVNVLDLLTGESRTLIRRSGSEYFDDALAWSPDDRYIATSACSGNPCGLAVVDTRSGHLRSFGPQSYTAVDAVAWLPDQRHLLALIAGGNTMFQLLLVDYPSGRTQRITNDLDTYSGLSLSAAADVLASSFRKFSYHLWAAPWSGNALGEPVQITTDREGTFFNGLVWAGRDELIASTPDAEGWNLSLIRPGEQVRPITQGPYYNAEQAVCPDGRTVIFKSDRRQQLNLWKADLVTGETSPVTSGASVDSDPHCAPDSRSVLFVSDRGGRAALWRAGLDGSAPTMMFPLPGEDCAVSSNLKWVAVFDGVWSMRNANLDIIDAHTGSLVRKLAPNISGHLNGGGIRWTPDDSGLLIEWEQNGATNLWLQPAQGGPLRQITHFQSGRVKEFAFSPDGRRLAFAQGTDTTDVVLMRDYVSRRGVYF